jgi:putative hydrolase of the HAD superfamily
VEQLRAVVFDLDGTLLDHRSSTRAGLTAWLGERGVAFDDAVEQAWFAAEEEHFGAWRRGEIEHGEQRRRRMRDFLPAVGLPVGAGHELDEIFLSYLEAYRQAWRGYDDVDEAIELVRGRGLATAILTNGTPELQEAKLAALGLLDSIGPVLCATAIGAKKPDPEAFRQTHQRLGLAPGEVLYVGDEHEVDVLGARAAGLHAVLLDRDGDGPAEEPERIARLTELERYLPAAEVERSGAA